MSVKRYSAEARFVVTLPRDQGGGVLRVNPGRLRPYVAVDCFDALQVAVLKFQEAYGDLGELEEVRLIRIDELAGGEHGSTTTDIAALESGPPDSAATG